MKQVFIGLGSNLADPQQQLTVALKKIACLPNTQLDKTSSFYRSLPLGADDQPEYLNAVVKLTTHLGAEDLLNLLQQIETDQGRVRLVRWGPRNLDLDILLYGNEIINTERLQVPHPGIKTREFVLYPLVEIAPELRLPTGEFIRDLLGKCQRPVSKLGSNHKPVAETALGITKIVT